MKTNEPHTMVVMGATGTQGGAVSRHLLAQGWKVRAVTRDPSSPKAKALAALGAEVVQADMEDMNSLLAIFEDARGVFSVQNPMISGTEAEIRQGKNVAQAAKTAGVEHLVYASAGFGVKGTGVPSWESKLVVEEYIKSLDIPWTMLRPMAFMELMTEKKYFPMLSTWSVMPRLTGSNKKIVWIGADDLGFVAAKALAEPERFAGKSLRLTSDTATIDECRQAYREVMGKNPTSFPMPTWMFERYGFVGKDCCIMWRWLKNADLDLDTSETRSIHPQALTVREWLKKQRAQNPQM